MNTKKIILVCFSVSLLFLFSSCEDFLQQVPYDIKIDVGITNGTVTADVETALPGSIIQVTAEPINTVNNLKELEYYYTADPSKKTAISITNKKFVMPPKNITITAKFGNT